ncbi:cytochrome oxidase putative small subunit CydP [Fluviicoccus sp.]|uniref:cytochrome oxidase putative small subunit CydP n=1 Tax=Fluviicoccus sp. TaxID=2003552 RepID=UPI00351F795F
MRQDRLKRDITLLLLIKAGLLWGIWCIWFSHPVAPHMQMPVESLDSRILSTAPLSSPSPTPIRTVH